VGGASGDGRGDRGVIYPRGRGRGRAGLATGLGRWPACLTVLCISYFRGLEIVTGRFRSPPNIGPCSG
jgi:hypothetical protein